MVGGKETTMQSFVRRARGMHEVRTPSSRSRNGSTQLYTTNGIVSITKFNGDYYFTDGTSLYKNGTSVFTAGGGGNITPHSFLKLPPQPGVADQLFFLCSGTEANKKINTSDVVTAWGINVPSPLDTLTVTDNGAGALSAGTYRYQVVYMNSTTGSRSNPVSTGSIAGLGASRQLSVTSIPTSPDSQVDRREIYRTVANGARYFRVTTLGDNTTTTYNDNNADTSLSSIELQFDNVAPQFAPPQGFDFYQTWVTQDRRVWWLDTDGNAYYSPPGRPESVRGFIKVGTTDDYPTRGLMWNGANWIFTTQRLFRVFGEDEPFVAIPIDGVPGTDNAQAITITPYGIAYISYDGVYLFDGSQAQLIGYDEVAPIFKGETLENILQISSICNLTYANNQLYLTNPISNTDSDGVLVNGQTLVFDFRSQTWRELGLNLDALYKEPDSRNLIASFADNVYQLEVPGTVDDDTAGNINIEWEIGGALTDIAHYGTLQRVYVDINTRSNDLTVTAIIDGTATTLSSTLNTSARATVELPMPSSWQARVFSIRISGSIDDRVELFGLAVDVKLEGGNSEKPGVG